MHYIFGALLGYIIHDAVQPTAIGKVLDKVALPADLLRGDSDESKQTTTAFEQSK